jgi:hypothetical protein
MAAPTEYAKLTVDELKAELEKRGLPKSGKKDELIARLEDDDTAQGCFRRIGHRVRLRDGGRHGGFGSRRRPGRAGRFPHFRGAQAP